MGRKHELQFIRYYACDTREPIDPGSDYAGPGVRKFQAAGRRRLSQAYKAPRNFFWDIGGSLTYKLRERRFRVRDYSALDI
jgi:hypothetical protein